MILIVAVAGTDTHPLTSVAVTTYVYVPVVNVLAGKLIVPWFWFVLSTPLPVVHVKLVAVVLAVKLTVPLVHVVFGFAVAVTVGKAFTVTSTDVTVEVHPVNVFVPVTVYVLLVVGDTVAVLVVAVVLHVYVSAPFAVNTTGLPAQVVALDADTVGKVFTSIVMVSVVLAQPCCSPVIVYVVCTVGLNVNVPVVVCAGFVTV